MDAESLKKLPTDVESLQRLALQLQKQINNLRREIDILMEERRLERARRFAAHSEKNALQYCLFDEVENLVEEQPEVTESNDDDIEVKAHTRRGGRKPLPKDLPRVTVIHDLEDHERHCGCGCTLEKIDEIKTEQLDIIPAQVTVIEHVRYKYACKHCDRPPKTAAMPDQPIPKSRASAGFLAYVATSKYADGIPLYRQCHAFERLGIEQERHTLAHQMIKAGHLVQPLINLMQDYAISYPILQMDETHVQVLKESGRSASQESFMWVMRGGPPPQSVVLFNYEPTRAQSVPIKLLSGYQGYLQTDGYAGYNGILATEGIIGVGCWQRARRKFTDAQKAIKRSDKKPYTRVQQALRFIGRLYDLEKRVKNASYQERYELRQRLSLPVLDELKNWLTEQNINPQGKLGEAITYTVSAPLNAPVLKEPFNLVCSYVQQDKELNDGVHRQNLNPTISLPRYLDQTL